VDLANFTVAVRERFDGDLRDDVADQRAHLGAALGWNDPAWPGYDVPVADLYARLIRRPHGADLLARLATGLDTEELEKQWLADALEALAAPEPAYAGEAADALPPPPQPENRPEPEQPATRWVAQGSTIYEADNGRYFLSTDGRELWQAAAAGSVFYHDGLNSFDPMGQVLPSAPADPAEPADPATSAASQAPVASYDELIERLLHAVPEAANLSEAELHRVVAARLADHQGM
jgi:hypothetical protein